VGLLISQTQKTNLYNFMEPLHVNAYQTLISYSVSFEDTDGVPPKMSAVDDLRRHLANIFLHRALVLVNAYKL